MKNIKWVYAGTMAFLVFLVVSGYFTHSVGFHHTKIPPNVLGFALLALWLAIGMEFVAVGVAVFVTRSVVRTDSASEERAAKKSVLLHASVGLCFVAVASALLYVGRLSGFYTEAELSSAAFYNFGGASLSVAAFIGLAGANLIDHIAQRKSGRGPRLPKD